MSEKKVIIIGAGPAGLSAAYELLKRSDIKPIILEAEDFIGGISRTFNYKGNRMDIGGHRFFTKNDRVNKLWEEILPLQGKQSSDDLILNREIPLNPDGPDPEVTDDVMLIRHRVSRIYFLNKFFDYPISLKMQTFINMGFLRTMKCGFGYLGACLHKREEKSLADFYINRFGKPLYQLFFEDYTSKVWGVDPINLSPDWGAQRVKSLSLGKTLLNAITKPFRKKETKETSLIGQFEYPKKGPGELYEKMAERIKEMGGQILMKNSVSHFEVEDKKITKIITSEGDGFECDAVFSTMPIKDLFFALGKERVPEDVFDIATNLPYRDFITVGLLIDKLAIKNKTKMKTVNDIIPDNWIYVQDRGVKMGRIQIFNNWSPYMVQDTSKIWIGLEYFCNEGDEMWESSDEAFIDLAISELIKIGMISSKDNVLDSVRLRVKKAYPAYFGTYDQFDKVREWLNGYSNLYCIGRNGQHRYNNMDHSMLSALTAVDNFLENKPEKDEIWNVNTEQEYHETK